MTIVHEARVDLDEPARGLDLTRRGTLFASPEVERAFLIWQVEQTIPLARASLYGGVFGIWSLVVGVCLATRPAGFMPWSIGIGAVMILSVAALRTMRQPKLHPWSQPLCAMANAVAGHIIIGLMAYHFEKPVAAASGVAVALAFAFGALRVRPWQAIAATLPYTFFMRWFSACVGTTAASPPSISRWEARRWSQPS